ncbi:MAG: radical SAM protein [Thermoprotei archaeon]|nr:MAG: radical SAM protein [Thermoprotei archaeon]
MCYLARLGYESCNCLIDGRKPCEVGLRYENGKVYRLVYDIQLSRPEDYLSIYQSCCNHDCKMCHSFYFSRKPVGKWMSPEDIVDVVRNYVKRITVWEPRDRATMWHASDLCMHCGSCVLRGEPGPFCPRRLEPWQVTLSEQGFGPARNIVSFTGGDLLCRPEFYTKVFELIKSEVKNVWVKVETNGYGLVKEIVEEYATAGLDSVWLDLKAFSEDVYRWLTGTTNRWVLKVPELLLEHNIVLEIVLLYIPGVVELDELGKFGKYIADIDPEIPVMLLAYFPRYKLSNREPTLLEMVRGYHVLIDAGLKRVKVGNCSVFCKTASDWELLLTLLPKDAIAG